MNGILKLLLFIAKHEGMARKKSFFLEVSKVSKVEGFEGRLIDDRGQHSLQMTCQSGLCKSFQDLASCEEMTHRKRVHRDISKAQCGLLELIRRQI